MSSPTGSSSDSLRGGLPDRCTCSAWRGAATEHNEKEDEEKRRWVSKIQYSQTRWHQFSLSPSLPPLLFLSFCLLPVTVFSFFICFSLSLLSFLFFHPPPSALRWPTGLGRGAWGDGGLGLGRRGQARRAGHVRNVHVLALLEQRQRVHQRLRKTK